MISRSMKIRKTEILTKATEIAIVKWSVIPSPNSLTPSLAVIAHLKSSSNILKDTSSKPLQSLCFLFYILTSSSHYIVHMIHYIPQGIFIINTSSPLLLFWEGVVVYKRYWYFYQAHLILYKISENKLILHIKFEYPWQKAGRLIHNKVEQTITFASQQTGCNRFPCQKMPLLALGRA